MKLWLNMALLFISFAGFSAKAETLTCKGEVNFYGEVQKFTVTIEGDGIGQAYTPSQIRKIEVQGASLDAANTFENATDYWDGHANGMITAPGFSMTYANTFGCIRDVVITTDFRGSVKDEGLTVGHVAQSQVIALCESNQRSCSN